MLYFIKSIFSLRFSSSSLRRGKAVSRGTKIVSCGAKVVSRGRKALLVLSLGLLAACSDDSQTEMNNHSAMATDTAVKAERWYTQEMVNQGKPLYQENCAQCHGGFGQGNPDWRKPTADGRYLPPPLNGTGHAWHHPLDQLRGVIKHGRGPDVPSDMPAWKDKMTDQEIDSVIAWFQSRWPDKIYQAWSRPKH